MFHVKHFAEWFSRVWAFTVRTVWKYSTSGSIRSRSDFWHGWRS